MKKINEVSKIVGVSKRTLQYYDDEGLLVVQRSPNNHRLYDRDALERIWEIMLYKEMGFDLKEIRYLLSLPKKEQQECFRQRIETIEGQLDDLQSELAFISLVSTQGIPRLPKSGSKTYTEYIDAIKKNLNYNTKGEQICSNN